MAEYRAATKPPGFGGLTKLLRLVLFAPVEVGTSFGVLFGRWWVGLLATFGLLLLIFLLAVLG